MAFTYGFYNSKNKDRRYNADQMSQLFDGILNDGVFQNVGDFMTTVPGTGLQVLVKSGRAWFNSTWSYNDAPYPLSLEQPDVAVPRKDAIVLEVDHTETVRRNRLLVVKGIPSSSLPKPDLTNTDLIHQHALAYVTVKAGVSSITPEDIEILVGKSECPFVTGILETANLDDLFDAWEHQFTTWFDDVQSQLEGDVATNLLNQINQRVKISDLASQSEAETGSDNSKWMTPLRVHQAISEHPEVGKVEIGDEFFDPISVGTLRICKKYFDVSNEFPYVSPNREYIYVQRRDQDYGLLGKLENGSWREVGVANSSVGSSIYGCYVTNSKILILNSTGYASIFNYNSDGVTKFKDNFKITDIESYTGYTIGAKSTLMLPNPIFSYGDINHFVVFGLNSSGKPICRKIDLNTAEISAINIPSPINNATGIGCDAYATDSSGNFYVSIHDSANRYTIFKITPSGGISNFLGLSADSTVYALIAIKNDILYVMEFNGSSSSTVTITLYSLDGSKIRTFTKYIYNSYTTSYLVNTNDADRLALIYNQESKYNVWQLSNDSTGSPFTRQNCGYDIYFDADTRALVCTSFWKDFSQYCKIGDVQITPDCIFLKAPQDQIVMV